MEKRAEEITQNAVQRKIWTSHEKCGGGTEKIQQPLIEF